MCKDDKITSEKQADASNAQREHEREDDAEVGDTLTMEVQDSSLPDNSLRTRPTITWESNFEASE